LIDEVNHPRNLLVTPQVFDEVWGVEANEHPPRNEVMQLKVSWMEHNMMLHVLK
jgi:hypothetical protein